MSKYKVNYRILGDSNRFIYTTIVEGTMENNVALINDAVEKAMIERDIEGVDDIEILDFAEL